MTFMTPPPYRRALWFSTLVVAWLGAMAWLVFQEAYPDLLDRAAPGYRSLLARGVMIMDRWMIISFQNRPIGYTHTSVDVNEKDPAGLYRVKNQTFLTLTVMGNRQRLSVQADAVTDSLYALQSFKFSLAASGYSTSIDGSRKKGDTFDVTIHGSGSTQHLSISIPDDAVVYSPMTEMTLKSLSPGQKVSLKIFNPVTMSSQTVTVRALRRETIHRKGKDTETVVLSARMDGMETLSWVDADGTMIRQETPIGWTMESCEAREALSLKTAGMTGDLLTVMAVPITGPADLLSTKPTVRLRLRGASLPREQLETQRQSIISLESNVTEVIVRADSQPAHGCSRDAIPADLKPWLAATPYIQSTDARLINKAREITGDWTDSLVAANAIYRWVNENVTKNPTASIPSALDVLAKPEGDCNEHTYLFVGLARAAGLPSRVRVGVTLNEGRFYYHAWPSVYVGRWLDMDPTLGRPAVNAGYLSLVEGELDEQMKLMTVIGKLNVEVIP